MVVLKLVHKERVRSTWG